MSTKVRRRPSRRRVLRRALVEHRYAVAEGLLGALALTLVLLLFWPESEDPSQQMRERWVQSLIEREGQSEQAAVSADQMALNIAYANATSYRDQAKAQRFELARASMAVMARDEHKAEVDAVAVSLAERRLVTISETMPEIGPLAATFLPSIREVAVRMPPPQPVYKDLDGLDVAKDVAAAVPLLRVPPRRMAEHEWLRQAAVEPVDDGRPQIAIVIDDLGNNRRNTAAFNRLPGPLTLAFLPYADDLPRQTMAARAAGHELMLHMPMEPVGDEWPGPGALLISITQADFRERLQRNFASFDGFVGINNHMGSRLTADWPSMEVVMEEVRRRDLLFLDSKTTHASIGTQAARSAGVPHAQRDVFLDNIPHLDAVLRQLRSVEAVARRKGAAIAIGHPNDVTIQALRQWLPGLSDRGFSLVPVSTIVALRTCQREPLLAGCRDTSEPVRVEVGRTTPSEG